VARLRCFRAVDTLTALSIHLELGADWHRFEKAPRVGAWLGLTPSLTQSGESQTQGHTTKTGSTLARRLLIEAAWHYGPDPMSDRRCRLARTGSPSTCSRSPTKPKPGSIASTAG
jgi:transposase